MCNFILARGDLRQARASAGNLFFTIQPTFGFKRAFQNYRPLPFTSRLNGGGGCSCLSGWHRLLQCGLTRVRLSTLLAAPVCTVPGATVKTDPRPLTTLAVFVCIKCRLYGGVVLTRH